MESQIAFLGNSPENARRLKRRILFWLRSLPYATSNS